MKPVNVEAMDYHCSVLGQNDLIVIKTSSFRHQTFWISEVNVKYMERFILSVFLVISSAYYNILSNIHV